MSELRKAFGLEWNHALTFEVFVETLKKRMHQEGVCIELDNLRRALQINPWKVVDWKYLQAEHRIGRWAAQILFDFPFYEFQELALKILDKENYNDPAFIDWLEIRIRQQIKFYKRDNLTKLLRIMLFCPDLDNIARVAMMRIVKMFDEDGIRQHFDEFFKEICGAVNRSHLPYQSMSALDPVIMKALKRLEGHHNNEYIDSDWVTFRRALTLIYSKDDTLYVHYLTSLAEKMELGENDAADNSHGLVDKIRPSKNMPDLDVATHLPQIQLVLKRLREKLLEDGGSVDGLEKTLTEKFGLKSPLSVILEMERYHQLPEGAAEISSLLRIRFLPGENADHGKITDAFKSYRLTLSVRGAGHIRDNQSDDGRLARLILDNDLKTECPIGFTMGYSQIVITVNHLSPGFITYDEIDYEMMINVMTE